MLVKSDREVAEGSTPELQHDCRCRLPYVRAGGQPLGAGNMCTFTAEDNIGRPSAGPREIDARSLVGRQMDAEFAIMLIPV